MEGREEMGLSTAAPPPQSLAFALNLLYSYLKFLSNLGQVPSGRDSDEILVHVLY